ncbi:hypothetical protein ES703_57775 [subsurface metagenome]
MTELEDLVVSGEELDQKLVAEILAPYVRLDKDRCSIRPIEGWLRLSEEQKILVYLLARKAMVALNFDLATEGVTASEVVQNTGVKKGTAHPALRKLLNDDRLLEQSTDHRYFVPNYAIPQIKSILSEKKVK